MGNEQCEIGSRQILEQEILRFKDIGHATLIVGNNEGGCIHPAVYEAPVLDGKRSFARFRTETDPSPRCCVPIVVSKQS